MMRRIIYITVLLGAFLLEGSAQQVPLYSQYMLNGFLLNPAAAGAEGYTAANLTVREQWVGFSEAPSTYALSFQHRIIRDSYISRSSSIRRRRRTTSRGGKVGLGGYIYNDRNGAVERTGLKATYAYHIPMPHSQLSFGLSFSGYQFRLDDDLINLEDPGDALWLGASKSVFIPDADVGVYYSARDYWAGFSVDQLLESTLKIGDAGYDRYKMERNYYLMGGYDFKVRRDVILTPSTLVKYAENGELQVDISGKLYYQQSYWGGLSYRTGHTIIVMAGVSVDRLMFGYAFDIGLGSIMKHSYGTHEFSFIVKFGNIAQRYRWLNRY
ncbi:MAG: type IX secretion system membrane protein PorP/SprF [Bacteroidota bacterium]